MKLQAIFLLTFLSALNAFAQKGGPVIFTVGQDTVWGAEFERVYSKNNMKDGQRPSMSDLEEYRDLYVKFKLKVNEAYALGMDSNKAFVDELSGYRSQLAKPYLSDKEITDNLIREAYERMQMEVDASNLMVHVSTFASPADTLKAFNRIREWKRMIDEDGVSFEQLAADSSTDEYGRKHKGRLGYFSVFNMIYPFENQAYTTMIGDVSDVFRTEFGYHIVKVNNKRPARGEVKVAHILIRTNNESEYQPKKEKIDAIHQKLNGGEDWNELVLQFTEDFSTRMRNGELSWVKSIGGNLPPELTEMAFSMTEDGQISEPFRTNLGWHIIKRIEKRPIRTLESVTEFLKYKISNDSRSRLGQSAVLKRIKSENGYVENRANIERFLSSIDSTFLYNIWKPSAQHITDDVLFTIGDKVYTFADMSATSTTYKNSDPEADLETVKKDFFQWFSNNSNLEYEEAMLEKKYDDFRYLMQEYRDGILLFELTNKEVWNKASEDTLGLQEYFESHRENYRWADRLSYRVYKSDSRKTAKKVKKKVKKGWSDKTTLEKYNKKSPLAVRVDHHLIERGDDTKIDSLDWNTKIHDIEDGSKSVVFLRVDEVIPSGLKELKETMGPVTSDYQDHLELLWIEELKAKYPVKISEGALNEVFTDL